jgi:DNA-binding transcriptional MocR family regulator
MAQYLYCMADNIIWSPKLTKNEQPYYLQLVDEMARAIQNGDLSIGEKLPPQRQLAWHLNVNLSTVTKAFKLATKRHLIAGEVGRGTYVLGQSSEAELYNLKAKVNNNAQEFVDLSTHLPAIRTQDQDLDNTLIQLMKKPAGLSECLEYLSPQSLKYIQISSSKWLSEFGYFIESKNCLATSTAQNALLVTLLASCNQDDVVLVDELTFPGMKTVAKQLRLKLYGVKCDEQGIVPDALDLAIRSTGAKVLVSDPTMQNPTAAVMGGSRRNQFIDVIKQYDLLFIEEYVLGTLINRPPVSHSIKEHSILITSFAKAVSPGVRFAVIAGEHPMIKTIALDAHATSWQLSPLMASVACYWINTGLTNKRLLWQREEILVRYRIFETLFPKSKYKGGKEVTSHVWLPVNTEATTVAMKLSEQGVEVVPSVFFAVNHHFPQYIRVSLTAAKSRQQLKKGLAIIKAANVVKQVSGAG